MSRQTQEWLEAQIARLGRGGQKRLAALLGIDETKVSKMKKGERRPQPGEIERIAAYLKVPPPPGFSDPHAVFETADGGTFPDVIATVQGSGGDTWTLRIALSLPAFGLLAGDTVAVSLSRAPRSGDLVLASEHDGSESKGYLIFRMAGDLLVPADPTAPLVNSSPMPVDMALHGPIIAVARALT